VQLLGRVAVFGGSGDTEDAKLLSAAASLGALVGRMQAQVLCAGVKDGLIGHFARSCIEAGGAVWGIMLRREFDAAKALDGLQRIEVVESSVARKEYFAIHATAFVALAGGAGTISETMDILARRQLGECSKPLAILNTNGYYKCLFEMIRAATGAHLQHPRHLESLIVASEPHELVDSLSYRLLSGADGSAQ
jgi:uncharacterized protein (TIGR00730 family)